MKTNVVMKSSDRNLFGVVIQQRTENSFLCLSDLQKAYEVARWKNGWSDRRINDIVSGIDFKERVYYILKERCIIETDIVVFMKMLEDKGITNALKGLGVWKTTGRGSNRSVYVDPYIWVMIALEMNPFLYAKVIMWLTDTLIFDRIEAGTEFKPMNSAIKSIVATPDYPKYAIAINKKVFGHHQPGMRNLASARELSKITKIEQFVVNAIELGLIKDEDGVMSVINNNVLQ